MNLSYYRHHESVDDDDPMYEVAMEPDQIPTWPASLRKLQIEHVRQWTSEAALAFLQSLVDQAENLPDLRYLVFKTILDIPWQERATMRREWRAKIEKIYLRPYQAPIENTTIVREEPSAQTTEMEDSEATPRKRRRTKPSPSRRSGRLASQDARRESDEADDIEVPFVQGLCNIVNIVLDNGKPRELQFGMQDFLSEESESEEEWNADREDEDDFIAF